MPSSEDAIETTVHRIGAGGYWDAIVPLSFLAAIVALQVRVIGEASWPRDRSVFAISAAVAVAAIVVLGGWAMRAILRQRNARALVTADGVVLRDWRGRETTILLRDILDLRWTGSPTFMVRARVTASLRTASGAIRRHLTGWAEEDVILAFAEDVATRAGMTLTEERSASLLRFVSTKRWEAPDASRS